MDCGVAEEPKTPKQAKKGQNNLSEVSQFLIRGLSRKCHDYHSRQRSLQMLLMHKLKYKGKVKKRDKRDIGNYLCFQEQGIVLVHHVHPDGANIFKKEMVGDKNDKNFYLE